VVLIYAFSNQWGTNVSRRTLSELQRYLPKSLGINYQVIFGHPRSFFNKYIRNDVYDLIIGLGDFWGDDEKIRIETVARNVYGKESIYPLAPIKAELSLPEIEMYEPNVFEITENMGTYNCNWIAFEIQLVINKKNLKTKNLFLHLPKRARANFLAKNIADLIEANQMLK
jgi:pyrrolidone-carboxylate peptidase